MYTIVVADDEEELRRAIIRKIDWESIGFQVVGEAENGIEALELVERMEPDLLLTDIRMPFVSGIELARQVREVRPTTQIAFLSGFDEFSYAQQAIQYNIISYMLKPITMVGLTEELKKINRIIDKEYPDAYRETLVVLDGTTGQNALAQAKQFMEVADITGIILTKLDGTAKGGIAVAIQSELGIPVKYVGIGEKIDDLQKFDANDFVNALFKRNEALTENE